MRMPNYKGGVYSIADLARMAGIARNTIDGRLASGWSVDQAVETPVQGKSRDTGKRKNIVAHGDALFNAALSICKTISGDPAGHNFRRISPDEFGFDGDILSWRIRLKGNTALHLVAYYRKNGQMSTTKRVYHVTGAYAEEVQAI